MSKESIHQESAPSEDVRENVISALKGAKKREITARQADSLIAALKTCFDLSGDTELRETIGDFAGLVETSLRAAPEKMYAIHMLRETGGDTQLVGIDGDELIFEDRCKESPVGRRNLDFNESLAQAEKFCADMQSPKAYRAMQDKAMEGRYDTETESWLATERTYIIKMHEASLGFCGGGGVCVWSTPVLHRSPDCGWRASLRVKIV